MDTPVLPGIAPPSSSGSARGDPFRRRSLMALVRPDLQMTTFERTPATFGLQEISSERNAPPNHNIPPPPLAPYVSPEKRFFPPFPGDHRGGDPRQAVRPRSSGSASIPSPQRPAPLYIPPFPHVRRPLSPVASQRQTQPPPLALFPQRADRGYLYSEDMSRSHSQSSEHSNCSASSGRVSRTQSSESGGRTEEGSRGTHASSEPAQEDVVALQRPKRSRVLMTNMQQQLLSILWKRTKFPNTEERQEIAAEVALTPRQVQVWFQNRRQNFRKQLLTNAMPEQADPDDYADLQQSPRSRRMSLEQSSDDRFSRRGVSTSATSVPSRSMPLSVSEGQPADPGQSVHQSRRYITPSASSSRAPYAQSPPSPMKRKLELDSRPLGPHRSSWQSSWAPGPSSIGASPSSQSTSRYGTYPLTLSPPPNTTKRHGQRPVVPLPRRVVSLSGMPDLSESARPSHLPPSLTALALTRPVETAGQGASSSTLPSFDLSSSTEAISPMASWTSQRPVIKEVTSERLPTLRDIFGERHPGPSR